MSAAPSECNENIIDKGFPSPSECNENIIARSLPSPIEDLDASKVFRIPDLAAVEDTPILRDFNDDTEDDSYMETDCFFVQLYRMYACDTGFLADFTLTVRGRVFKVHKVVLAAHSRYFRELLMGYVEWEESLGDSMEISRQGSRKNSGEASPQDPQDDSCSDYWKDFNELTIDKLPADAVAIVMDYFYRGWITAPWHLIMQVYDALDYFEVDKILDKLCEYIMEHITPSNCFEWLLFSTSEDLDDHKLRFHMQEYVRESYDAIFANEKFLEQSLQTVQRLLESRRGAWSRERAVPAEEAACLRAVFRWAAADPRRHQHLHGLFTQIRLEQCGVEVTAAVREEYPGLWATG